MSDYSLLNEDSQHISYSDKNCAYVHAEKGQYESDEDDYIISAIEKLLKGRYKILSSLGKGAQGNVYLGRHLDSGKNVAIKQMRIASLDDWKQYDLFHREADVLSSLNIDGVAHFYEAVEDLSGSQPMSVIIQEYIDGKSIQTYFNEGRRFQFTDICSILLQLLDILEKLHQHNPPVIHRDVKPSNIILHYDDGKYAVRPKVYLIDFGAVANPQVQDGGSTVTGTYGYMAPEQLMGKPTSVSDLYSFAVLAVYLLSGVPPEDIEIQDLRLVIDPHLENYPYVVTSLLRQMLEINPVYRLADYRYIRSTLQKFAKQDFNVKIKSISSKSAAEHTLETVSGIGEAGNVDLWQALPDLVPRAVPRGYKQMIMSCRANLSGLKKDKTIDKKLCNLCFYTPKRHFFAENAVFFLAGINIIIFAAGLIVHTSVIPLPWWCIAALISLLICADLIVFLVRGTAFRKYGHLIQYGRKTLAVVDSIECPTGYALTYQKRFSGLSQTDDLKEKHHHANAMLFSRNFVWKIVYSFNPPDDSDPSPLRHIYYSYKPVLLKKGDILPILYEIGIDKKNSSERVYSMPFPLPADSSLIQCADFAESDVRVFMNAGFEFYDQSF